MDHRQVILDSDDDEDAASVLSSLDNGMGDQELPTAASSEHTQVTDPMYFQQVYDAEQAAVQAPDITPAASYERSEEPIFAISPSALKRLKRSRSTIETDTVAKEENARQTRAKRAKSDGVFRELEEPIFSLNPVEAETDVDIWAIPSSQSDSELVMSKIQVKSSEQQPTADDLMEVEPSQYALLPLNVDISPPPVKLREAQAAMESVYKENKTTILIPTAEYDPFVKHTGESSTVPNDTQVGWISPKVKDIGPGQSYIVSSSPPVLSNTSKRSKSDSNPRSNTKSFASEPSSTQKRRAKRSRTSLGEGELPDGSVDELSLPGLDHSLPKLGFPTISNGKKAKKAGYKVEDSDDLDELSRSLFDELPKENYKPRPTRSRRKSAGAQDQCVIVEPSKKKLMTRRSKSTIETSSSLSSLSSEEVKPESIKDQVVQNNEDTVVETLDSFFASGFLPRDHPRRIIPIEASLDANKGIATRNAKPRRRASKKAVKEAAPESASLSDSAPPEQTASVRQAQEESTENTEQQTEMPKLSRLQTVERGSTPASTHSAPVETTPTKDKLASPVKAQTPSKSSPTKGPVQHSPLRNGKVPYRVGLSKRTRIAPLLKCLRK